MAFTSVLLSNLAQYQKYLETPFIKRKIYKILDSRTLQLLIY